MGNENGSPDTDTVALRPSLRKTVASRAAPRRVDGGFQHGLRLDAMFDLPGRPEPSGARVASLVAHKVHHQGGSSCILCSPLSCMAVAFGRRA
jgi:hypothetical protein